MCKKNNKGEMFVRALKNGTVIDHIPSDKLFAVVSLLHLDKLKNRIIIGFNLNSEKIGKKSIIKVSDKYFSSEELNQLSVLAPNVTLNIIKEYEIIEKYKVEMPDELNGIIKCANPKCITNNEPMTTRFKIIDKQKGIIRCLYCEKNQIIDPEKLIR
jgi:aspartate carbamoyltransferase regulatory subunit